MEIDDGDLNILIIESGLWLFCTSIDTNAGNGSEANDLIVPSEQVSKTLIYDASMFAKFLGRDVRRHLCDRCKYVKNSIKVLHGSVLYYGNNAKSLQEFRGRCRPFSPFFKHCGWKGENEYRFVVKLEGPDPVISAEDDILRVRVSSDLRSLSKRLSGPASE